MMRISQHPPLQKHSTNLRAEIKIQMDSFIIYFFIFALLSVSAKSDDTSEELLKGINVYRTSLNLSTLTENSKAACLADQIAENFKGQPCSNSTGSNTVPGTEEQFPNYLDFLQHCKLNATVTQDAAIMPACVPNLDPGMVLTNYTKSQYSGKLNDSSFVGAGIADEGDWVVVVFSTNTSTGDFADATSDDSAASGLVIGVGFWFGLMMFLGFLLVSN